MSNKSVLFKIMTILIVLGTIAPPAMSQEANSAEEIAKVKSNYTSVMSHLDPGGELLVIANVDGVMEDIIDLIVNAITLQTGNDPNLAKMRERVKQIPVFLKKNGFHAVRCVGISSVPRPDGKNNLKIYLNRDNEAAGLPLWRGMFGYAPGKLAGLDFIPAEAAVARTSNSDIGSLWKLVRQGVKELCSADTAQDFEGSLGQVKVETGVDIDTLIGSLKPDGFISVLLAKDKKIALPGGNPNKPMMIPEIAFLTGIEVADNSLVRAMDSMIDKPAGKIQKVKAGDTELHLLPQDPNSPFPLEMTWCVHKNFFLFGTTKQAVLDSIKARDTGKGLASSPAYVKAFKDLPSKNNGMLYISKDLVNAVVDIQKQALSQAAAGGGPGAPSAELMDFIYSKFDYGECAYVTVNLKGGVQITGVSSTGGRELIGSVTVAPIGIMAAIAIPSFVKARGTAQSNACINNMRMIDAAKEQWAMAENKINGDVVDIPAAMQFVRGGVLPICPAGGIYNVNKIGEDPTCTKHGSLSAPIFRR